MDPTVCFPGKLGVLRGSVLFRPKTTEIKHTEDGKPHSLRHRVSIVPKPGTLRRIPETAWGRREGWHRQRSLDKRATFRTAVCQTNRRLDASYVQCNVFKISLGALSLGGWVALNNRNPLVGSCEVSFPYPPTIVVGSNVTSRPAGILLPPHLYGELAKTERGCELLRKHGDLKNLLYIARSSGAPADDRKGALWAVVRDGCSF